VLATGVGKYEDSGEKIRFSLKNVEADVWSRDRMYDLPCHSGHTVPSPDERLEYDRETLLSSVIP
jgi:hypothetical protein